MSDLAEVLYRSKINGYKEALNDFIQKAEEEIDDIYLWYEDDYENGLKNGYQYSIDIAEQLKRSMSDDNKELK